MTKNEIEVIQDKIGYKFNNKDLLLQSFVRTSFKYEHRGYEDNEKLEFIGDKVLDCVVVKKLTKIFGLYHTGFVQSLDSIERKEKENSSNLVELTTCEFLRTQGEMTDIKKQVVQTSFLAKAVERLGLEQYLIVGGSDIVNNVKIQPHVKEDLFEAIIGAIAIDCNWDFDALEEVIDRILNLDYYIKNGIEDEIDYISIIQEWHQKEYGKEPEYFFLEGSSGALFACVLSFEGYDNAVFEGIGSSKKSAIRVAAKSAYEFICQKDNKSDDLLSAIKDYDFDNSVNKIQELSDKKLIKGLEFIERELPVAFGNNGNPTWSCECKVYGVGMQIVCCDTKKKTAKKKAAFEMLQVLTGKQASKETVKLNSILPL